MADGPIYWHQGLFLQPQHFQRTDQRTEDLLGQLAGLSRPWLWGVRSLAWDMGALKAGCLKPRTLQVLLPGMGLELSCPGNAVCPGRMVPDSLAAGSNIDVYIGLAPFREGEGNVGQAGENENYERLGTRLCLAEGMDDVPDLYGDGPSARMQRLNYVVQILLGQERDTAGNVVCLRVARMGRGIAWLDTGTVDSLRNASNFIRDMSFFQKTVVSAPEEIAYVKGWITKEKLLENAEAYGKSPYGEHLRKVAGGRFLEGKLFY